MSRKVRNVVADVVFYFYLLTRGDTRGGVGYVTPEPFKGGENAPLTDHYHPLSGSGRRYI